MKYKALLAMFTCMAALLFFSFSEEKDNSYQRFYALRLQAFAIQQQNLIKAVETSNLSDASAIANIQHHIQLARNEMKVADFWMRYLEPLAYKKVNSPLPVEWETEVFEKFEAPYKRVGAGLTLAAGYLEEEHIEKDTLLHLVNQAMHSVETYGADSITKHLNDYHHFFLCNRLYILNLAAIYTTGFDCPDADQVIPELRQMMTGVNNIYQAYNQSFPATPLTEQYLKLYTAATQFAQAQPSTSEEFDHFTFIRDYINPLYKINQQMINRYKVVTRSMVDFALNKKEVTIFDKAVYNGQNKKGIFLRVDDAEALAEIDRLGKMLFYDPILSANNMRSCASCHKPTQFFTDTTIAKPFQFNHTDFLPRNTPTLINAEYNHLMMLDGKHYTMQHQAKDVITNSLEMSGKNEEVLEKVLSCKEYKEAFKKLLKYTPTEKEINMEHISSALTFYYTKYSKYYAPFDAAINEKKEISKAVQHGYNLFMSKAQCGTCHFPPQFNGVKPPYVGSEFEVIGVPEDIAYTSISKDQGRYTINPAKETMHAFRTGTVRNAANTAPYMHNGVFKTLEEVIDFYDAGGGAGHGLSVSNQTLPADSLHLTSVEKSNLIAFVKSLSEEIAFEAPPEKLPKSKHKKLNARVVGGVY